MRYKKTDAKQTCREKLTLKRNTLWQVSRAGAWVSAADRRLQAISGRGGQQATCAVQRGQPRTRAAAPTGESSDRWHLHDLLCTCRVDGHMSPSLTHLKPIHLSPTVSHYYPFCFHIGLGLSLIRPSIRNPNRPLPLTISGLHVIITFPSQWDMGYFLWLYCLFSYLGLVFLPINWYQPRLISTVMTLCIWKQGQLIYWSIRNMCVCKLFTVQLWHCLRPTDRLLSKISRQWSLIGFQGDDPTTDFRGMGLLALENLVLVNFIVKQKPNTQHRISKL